MGIRTLITGGNGFIGSEVVKLLLKEGNEVWDFSLPSNTSPIENVKSINVDLRNIDKLKGLLRDQRFDFVINCAGYIDSQEGFDGETELLETHLIGTRNLLASLILESIKAFIHVGSAKEYGAVNSPIHENVSPQPTTPYGLAKLVTTEYVLMRSRLQNIPVAIVRPFVTYGIGKKDGIINYAIEKAITNDYIDLSDGQKSIDLIHVTDVAKGIVAAVKGAVPGGRIFNLGSGEGRKVREIINYICQVAGGGKPRWGIKTDRRGEMSETIADIQRSREELDWFPAVDCMNAIKKQIVTFKKTRGK